VTDKLQKVITSEPIDRTAAMVTSRGVRYESPKKIIQRHWEIPPSTIPVGPSERDFTGLRCGRFVVVGKLSVQKDSRGGTSLWLVRCDCSHYETRRSKSLRNPRNKGDCCERCRQLIYAKRSQHWRSTGN
jgi:hypothetical protein